ncbi:MAG: hypothetical protein ABI683_06770 [Ginsengibacter sp.]
MQKYVWAVIIISALFCGACHQKEEKETTTPQPISEELVSFFPVTEYFLGQLNELDTMPVTPLQIIFHDDKSDSIWLKRKDIRNLAKPFLTPVIDSVTLSKFFAGKSFLDQTVNAFTFSYDPKGQLPDSIKLKHWDVYVDPQKNNVSRVYMVEEDKLNGVPLTTQLTWESGKWFSVRTIEYPPGKEPVVKEQILKWSFDD